MCHEKWLNLPYSWVMTIYPEGHRLTYFIGRDSGNMELEFKEFENQTDDSLMSEAEKVKLEVLQTSEKSSFCLHFHVFVLYFINVFVFMHLCFTDNIATCIVSVCISETFALIMSLHSPHTHTPSNLLLATFSFQWNLWKLQIMTSSVGLQSQQITIFPETY